MSTPRQEPDLPAVSPDAAAAAKAWPFVEARKIIKRLDAGRTGTEVVFQTGYGPSGLPHIGTFGEVARTTMVRNAFRVLTHDEVPTRLICFSDDMDGLRRVPDNVPNQAMLAAHLDKPLSQVPNPFAGNSASFAHHNNARLRRFLDRFGFDYQFASATDYYRSGRFDAMLQRMLEVYDDVMNIMLPTLGAERRATYAPFLPICPRTGRVLQVPLRALHPDRGTIVYDDPETGEAVETAVTGGRVKCQWKADWAMRWAALGVDYEMSGKDLIDSVTQSSRICKALGAVPPEGFNFELFLDQNGAKISKSKGNGLTIDEWLAYADPESLSLFMYTKPRTAKRLYFDVIPKQVDEYFTWIDKFQGQGELERLNNPVWHIHGGHPPHITSPVSFALLLNLVSAANAEDKSVLWGFMSRYAPQLSPASHPWVDRLAAYAVRYFHDFVKPHKRFRRAGENEQAALSALRDELAGLAPDTPAADIQNRVYQVGKDHGFEPLRTWFTALYEVLLGQSQGPRFGSFVALYGIDKTVDLIDRAIAGALCTENE